MFYFVTMALRSFDCFNFSFQVSQRSLRKYIGVVPQDTVLFNDTVRYGILCEFYRFFLFPQLHMAYFVYLVDVTFAYLV